MSTSSPEQLGPVSDQLSQELLTKMSQFGPDGSIVQVMESQALIARRREAAAVATFRVHLPMRTLIGRLFRGRSGT
jgi:hypothetical protein